MAMSNDQPFHLAALLWRRGKLIRIGTNGRQSKIFKKFYSGTQSNISFFSHAEADALRYSQIGDRLEIYRWDARGNPTMAKPCTFCQSLIRQCSLHSVRYTNWQGEWENYELK